MAANSFDRRAIARKQIEESFYSYSCPRIDPLLEVDLRHGWMFEQVVKWDRLIYGRWDHWMDCAYENIKKNQISDYWSEVNPSIPKIDFLEPQFNYPGTQMLEYCLANIQHPRVRDRKFNITYFRYLVDWILFGLGDKNCTELAGEPRGCDGASSRLFQVFSVPHFMVKPCDYLGDCLEGRGYIPKLKSQDFIREWEVGEILKSSKKDSQGDYLENQIDDPEIVTGRVLLELSNHVKILSGISRNDLLAKCALINGYFFAPSICKHLCDDLASIYNPDTHEEISTWISEIEFHRLTKLCKKDVDLVGFVTDDNFYQILMTSGVKRYAKAKHGY